MSRTSRCCERQLSVLASSNVNRTETVLAHLPEATRPVVMFAYVTGRRINCEVFRPWVAVTGDQADPCKCNCPVYLPVRGEVAERLKTAVC